MEYTKAEVDALLIRLYNMHYKSVVAMVRKDFALRPYGEDIAQDVFKEAVRNGPKLMTHVNPDAWIFETARNKMMSQRRKLYYRRKKENVEVQIDRIGIAENFSMVELQELMRTVLNKHERMLFHMYHFGGYSARELASLEGITEGNFKVRMLRLRKKLKDKIQDKG